MAGKKIIFFGAGPVLTGPEAIALAELQSWQHDVFVRNASASMSFGPRLETADFVAGTVPDSYSAVPVWTPASDLPATQVAISNGVDIVVPVTGVYATKITPVISNGAITSFVLS